MWEQKLFELFITNIPQGLAFVLLYFSLTNIKIKPTLYVLTSVIYAVAAFLIRPYVNFGVHSIILMLLLVIIAVQWGKVKLLSAVIYAIVPFIVGYISEWITFIILGVIQFDVQLLKTNAQLRAMIGLIPLGMQFAVSFATFFTKKYFNKSKDGQNVAI